MFALTFTTDFCQFISNMQLFLINSLVTAQMLSLSSKICPKFERETLASTQITAFCFGGDNDVELTSLN